MAQREQSGRDDTARSYPIKEFFDRLGIKPSKGYQLIRAGEIKPYKVGRYTYATEDERQRFIRAQIAKTTNGTRTGAEMEE